MDCSYAYTHSNIHFYFKQNPRDFIVEEIPLYEFSGSGSHWILKIRKKNLTTFELLKILSSNLGIKSNEIGYAGLKDKNALSIQHISIPKSKLKEPEVFLHKDIKILGVTSHNNKLKIGHLKGNNFFIRLKKVDAINNQKIEQVLKKIESFGIPNYFAYQRFGLEGNNYQLGKEIIENKKKIRDKKMQNFLISAYQSYLFNQWLSLRIDISHLIENLKEQEIARALEEYLKTKEIPEIFRDIHYCKKLKMQPHFFKILGGDCLCHYPFGRNFFAESKGILEESQRFFAKNISITGLLSGAKMQLAQDEAGYFEQHFIEKKIKNAGQRRYAWIFPENITYTYKKEEAQGELSFFLPKGAYATNLLREIAHGEII